MKKFALVLLSIPAIIVLLAATDTRPHLGLPKPAADALAAVLVEEALHPAYYATWQACESLPSWGGLDRKVEKTVTKTLTNLFELSNEFIR